MARTDSAEADLLGLADVAPDSTMTTMGSVGGEQSGSIQVHRVELGKPIKVPTAAGTSGREGRKSDLSKRRRRKQSPAAELLRASIKEIDKNLKKHPGHPGHKHSSRGHDHKKKSSRRRRSKIREGRKGEKIYQGRTAKKQAEERVEERRQSSSPRQETKPPQQTRPQHEQPQSKQSHPKQPPQPPSRRKSSGDPQPKSEDTKIEKGYAPDDKNRDAWAKIRRRSRDGADAVRKRLAEASYTMRRRASQEANDTELERLKALRDAARIRRESRKRSKKPEGTAPDASDTARIAKINQELGYERRLSTDNRNASNRDSAAGGSSRREMERRMSNSTGHAPKTEGGKGKDGRPRRLSKSMELDLPDDDGLQRALDASLWDLHSQKSTDDADDRKQQQTTPASRRLALRRKHSLDSSMKGLKLDKKALLAGIEASKKDVEGKPKAPSPPSRARMGRRTSLDSSMRHLKAKSSEKEGARKRTSLDSSLKLKGSGTILPRERMPRRRSNSAGAELRTRDLFDDDSDEELTRLFAGVEKKKGLRKTHTGVVAGEKLEEETGERKDRRKSEADARKKSDYAKKLEARLKSTKKKQKQRSTASAAKGKGVSKRASGATTQVLTDESGDNSEDSRSVSGSALSRSDDGISDGKKRWPKLRLSPAAVGTFCLCYCISIPIFLGLGFWLHTRFGTTETASSNTGPTLSPSINNPGGSNAEDGDFTTKASGSSSVPTTVPSSMPSTTPLPSAAPTYSPSSHPSVSADPTSAPSDPPSFSPTSLPGCPEELLKTVALDETLTLRYEVVLYTGPAMEGSGLLCASLEYSGGAAGWIGMAFSEATRNPAFGRKEAIIGLPGIRTSVAVATDGTATLGQQIAAIEGGPAFANPGKYSIPAGGIGDTAYSGPALTLLADASKQTLMNGSVTVVSGQSDVITRMTFARYLEEPGEIEIDPFRSTLLLYAVAAPLDDGSGYEDNPDWSSTYVTFLDRSSVTKSGGFVRKRTRQHHH